VSIARPPRVEPNAQAATPISNRERRAWERYELANAEGKLIHRQAAMACRLVDISLGGCCVRTEKRFAAGALAGVDVVFDLHGLPQRIAGITQWTTKDHQVGIRFVHASPQAKNQLAALLTGLIDEVSAEAVREAVASAVITPGALVNRPVSSRPAPALPQADTPAPAFAESAQDSEAVVHFVKDGSQTAGAVVELTLENCTLHLVRPFTLGIYVRVEISFHIRGLFFQLAGVSQEIYDKQTIGFRFLDLSRRRREELAQAIEERRTAAEQSKSQP
jgi:PilZ domain